MISGSSSGQGCIWGDGGQTWRRSSSSRRRWLSADKRPLQRGERPDGEIDVLRPMRGAERKPQAAGAGDGGRAYRLGEDASASQPLCRVERLVRLAEQNREDCRVGPGGNPERQQAIAKSLNMAPESRPQLRLL